MTLYLKALGWAAAMILVAVGTRLGFYGENLSDALMMAILVMWVAVGMPRGCASRASQSN